MVRVGVHVDNSCICMSLYSLCVGGIPLCMCEPPLSVSRQHITCFGAMSQALY